MKQRLFGVLFGLSVAGIVSLATAGSQAAVDGCIDELRRVGGPDGQGGTVLDTQFSQAGTIVTLRDAGGTEWSCIGYSDGAVGDLAVVNASDDRGGAMATQVSSSSNRTERVQFAPGTSGAILNASLGSGDSVTYLLGAGNGQFLDVRLETNSRSMFYIIYVPDGDILFESSQGGNSYRGQLYETGDHRIEVFYNGNVGTRANARITVGIE